MSNAKKPSELTFPKDVDELALPQDVDELRQFLERAEGGDASTLPGLRQFLQNSEAVDKLGGDLARTAEQSLIAAAAGDNLLVKEALTRKLELLRAELAGPNPTPIERLLVERIVACWLQVQYADVLFAQQTKNLSIEWGDYLQRRMDRAHRRYLSAIKILPLVRKLALPALKVDVTKEQANPAANGRSPSANGSMNGAGHAPDEDARLGKLSGRPWNPMQVARVLERAEK